MKIITIILMFIPLISFSQTKDSIIVYQGNGSSENKIVDLSNKNLTKIPVVDKDVETLILDNNNLTEVPDWILSLHNLKSLSIRNNNLIDVSVLKHCENLQELYLSNNQNLERLPNFSTCEKLRIIDVINTKINEIPSSIRWSKYIAYFKYSVAKQ